MTGIRRWSCSRRCTDVIRRVKLAGDIIEVLLYQEMYRRRVQTAEAAAGDTEFKVERTWNLGYCGQFKKFKLWF